ncbi:hypothetical protein J2752_000354 [Halarchaeum rubridurum]|uniref:Uncharacterized protein n=1 Tax=Halarchaeum rubridurum TaxID=489911 RepID=A0A830FV55_9EURY|nr:hypothetical protein [Halarchaeum rubridurum]MBP1953473.1 hypothetical protein [Halarchaeum rubridurum]GGM64981.1 hypothetical protein GCM10009017_13850 [Halarchaeum rubridurum]
MTENHGYNTPAAGATDWHVPLNENFEAFDTDVEVRDTDANRTNYAPKAGAKFLATDTGRVYLGDGSAWSPLGSLSGDAAGGGGVTEALVKGNLVVLARQLAAPETIDPASTDTPVQDALDRLAASGGGTVRLPPTTITEAGTISVPSNAEIVGFGPDVSKVAITPAGVDGIVFDEAGGVDHAQLDGFALNGPGPGVDSGVAIHHVNGDTQNLRVGRLVLWGWTNSVYRVDQGVGPFQCRHEELTIYDCDAGAEDGLFEFRSWYGPANWFGTIAAYPVADTSGQNTTVFFTRGGTQTIDYLTMGGSAGTALHQTWDAQLRVESVHWEPTELRSTPDAIVRLLGHGVAQVGNVKHITGATRYVYELGYDPYNANAPAAKVLGPYFGLGGSLGASVVNLASAPDAARPSFYWGTVADVDVTHGDGATGGLRALGEAGTAVG